MNLPLHVTFRNLEPSPMVEKWIAEEAEKLELFYDHVIGCRVAVEVPHHHHRKGETFHIRVDLTLPGKEIVIKRQADLHSGARSGGEARITKHLEIQNPYKSLRRAIDDAFKAAGRRVQDYARRRRGAVKTHQVPLRSPAGNGF
jgi:ribosome-associated translation inhibitor RaiA